jgi:hypothetical protein
MLLYTLTEWPWLRINRPAATNPATTTKMKADSRKCPGRAAQKPFRILISGLRSPTAMQRAEMPFLARAAPHIVAAAEQGSNTPVRLALGQIDSSKSVPSGYHSNHRWHKIRPCRNLANPAPNHRSRSRNIPKPRRLRLRRGSGRNFVLPYGLAILTHSISMRVGAKDGVAAYRTLSTRWAWHKAGRKGTV